MYVLLFHRQAFAVRVGLPLLFFWFLAGSVEAQQLAFPGAEGGGRFAVGGRGGAVYEVTNLNDSGPGSLRDAVSQPNRTIVFRVSGVIDLSSALTISKGNITIAGQTAPGDGICITGQPIRIRASDIIIRHIRSRLSDVKDVEDDAMNCMSGNYQNIIIDHCSLGWSVDETGTFYDIKNFTLQWCILSESLYHSVHGKGNHGYGGIWGGNNASFHHNLLAHHTSRNPRFGGSRYTGKPAEEVVDFRNNVLYNWGNGNSVYGGEGGNYNMVNNYYKAGPATPGSASTGSTNRRNRILQYTSYYHSSDAAVYPDTLWGGKFYIDGNYVHGYPDVTVDNWTNGVQKDNYAKAAQLILAARQTVPFATPPVTTQTAEEAYTSVLQQAGACIPRRDAIDKRIINETATGTATYEGSTYAAINSTGISHPSGIIDTQADVGGLPAYRTATPPMDSDHDGMPDAWEIENGLNPNDAADRNNTGIDGYTYLENYLNSIVTSETTIQVTNNGLNTFSQQAGTPSSVKTYTVSATQLTNDLVITPPAGFEVSDNGGANWFSNSSPLTLAHAGGSIASTNISVRLNAAHTGSHSGIISHSSTATGTLEIPVTGITASVPAAPAGVAVTVAKDGSGNYTTVQAAVDAAPTGRTTPYIIYIRNGVYKEKITIPSNKPFLQFVGESVANVILTHDDYSGKPMPGGGTYGTSNSASVTVNANDFTAIDITFENTTGDAPQALAINVNADRAAFKNCRFLGGQDTILTNGSGKRQNYRNCYIDGVVDFIFGDAKAVFDSCIVNARSRLDGLNGSYITAANTKTDQQYGYVFRDCMLPSNTGVTKYVLGRPWQNSCGSSPVSYPKVVFLNARMGYTIKPEGWAVWDACTNTSSIYYAEYKSKKLDGTLANVSNRVPWSFQLSDAEAAAYTNATLFSDWDPCSAYPDFCTNHTTDIAVSNFRGAKGTSTSTLTWNLSWPISDVTFELFRSSDNSSFVKIHQQISANDTTINFSYAEEVPPPGTTYYYFIIASKWGKDAHVSKTIEISSTPTILTTGSLSNFLQGLGLPSATQAYQVSGVNLSGNITITPPPGFEVSANGTTWYANANPLVLVKSGTTVASTTISVRLNASAVGSYSGNIVHTSSGAATVNIAASGEVQSGSLPVSNTLHYWPLTVDGQDDANARHEGVAASQPSFGKLVLSDGTTVASIPPYGTTHGQAFSPVTGDGLWTTANGGPGGNLNRAFYEQFTVTSLSGYSVRVDSVVLNASFYNTSSNTKLAIVFSKSRFTTNDSTDVSGGKGPDGNPLLSSANGAFVTPVLLGNETGGNTRNYRFALAGITGVTIQNGETLTLRLYFSCGSTSTGRYAKLKDVYIKGFVEELAGTPTITVTGTLTDFSQTVGSPSEVQTYSVEGSSLKGNITVTSPAGYELSVDGGLSWRSSTSPLTLFHSAGTVSPTTISVRLRALTDGTYAGNISHTSTDAVAVNLAVNGAAEIVTSIPGNKESLFSVSPNPASDKLVVHHPVLLGRTVISVYNITGTRVATYSAESLSQASTIDVRTLPSGIYFVECWNGRERVMLRSMIRR